MIKIYTSGIDEMGRCFLEKSDIRDKLTIHHIIRRRVKPLSFVYPDFWKSYLGIEKPYDPTTGYGCDMGEHFRINHEIGYVEKINFDHPIEKIQTETIKITTNKCERMWRELKKHIKCVREYMSCKGEFITRIDEYLSSFV